MNRIATIASVFRTLVLAIVFLSTLSAQYTYSAFHSVTGTSATLVAIAQTAAHDAVVRFPSIVISCSGACNVRVYEGGTTANTLSATYPRKTKPNNTVSLLTPVNYVKFYTAADSSSGTLIGGGDCAGSCIYPISGILPDRGSNRHSMELPRKTDSQYYIAVTGSSIDVTFSILLEVVK